MSAATSPKWLAAFVLLAVLVGCARTASNDGGMGVLTAPDTPTPGAGPDPSAPAPRISSVTPTAIHIPSIGVAGAGFVPLGVDPKTRVLDTPDDHHPMTPGWWTGASTPGDAGTAVVVAHVDGYGQHGLFYNLSKLKAGDQIEVDRSDHQTAVFRVAAVAEVPKDQFPTASFYSGQHQPELHLATCGGRYDAKNHRYLDQVLVWATLVRLRPSS